MAHLYDTTNGVEWFDTTREIQIDDEVVKVKYTIAAALDAPNTVYISNGTNWINMSTNATITYYTLATTIGDNTTLTVVDANGRKLYNGDRIEPNAVLTITAGLEDSENYTLSTYTVNTVDKTASNPTTHTVSANVAIVTAATGDAYTLSLTQGENTTITVKDAADTTYAHNDDILYGTVLTITAAPATGYTLSTFTVDTVDETSPVTLTVGAANVAVVTAATVNTYKVLIGSGLHTTIAVVDGDSTAYVNGDDVDYGTELTITVTVDEDYVLDEFYVNGVTATSPKVVTVGAADVTIMTTADVAEAEG